VTDQPTLAQVAHAIRCCRFRYASEDDLQRGVHGALTQAGIPCTRETVVAPGCRVDHLCGRVAVEVKTAGSAGEVSRQLRRYLESGKIDGVVLVTSRVSHLRLQRVVPDKRVEVVLLAGAGLL
jgi:hypothetical protein